MGNNLNNQDQYYFQYLQKRSALGSFYRRFWLYPQLSSHLKGCTLDIGCGLGDMLNFRANTIGVDINPLNVNYCKGLGLDARLMEIDVLPFLDASFESVLLDNVLEHLADPSSLLREIHRVLKSLGCLLIGVPGVLGMHSDQDHKVFYTEERLGMLATQMGFNVSKTFYTPLWRSSFLSHHIRQYCIYTVWTPNPKSVTHF